MIKHSWSLIFVAHVSISMCRRMLYRAAIRVRRITTVKCFFLVLAIYLSWFIVHLILLSILSYFPMQRLDQILAFDREPVDSRSRDKCPVGNKCLYVATPLYRSYIGWPHHLHTVHVDCLQKCSLVKSVEESHASLFHAFDLPHRSYLRYLHNKRKPNQNWIIFSVETPKLFTFQQCFPGCKHMPQFLRNFFLAVKELFTASYIFRRASQGTTFEAGLFNWTMTYRQDSTIYYPSFGYAEPLRGRNKPALPLAVNITTKRHLAFAVISNCRPYNNRNKVIKALQKKMDLHVYGKCGTMQFDESVTFMELSKRYYFYISFENSYCKDYISEKFFRNGLNSDSIPVVFGGTSRTEVEIVAPTKSFIYALDFPSLSQLADYLTEVSQKPVLYQSFFDWRKNYKVLHDIYDIHKPRERNPFCQICERMHKADPRKPDIVDLNKVFQPDKQCRSSAYNPFSDV